MVKNRVKVQYFCKILFRESGPLELVFYYMYQEIEPVCVFFQTVVRHTTARTALRLT